MVQASDGAMWLADPVCDRMVRISRAGAWTAIALARRPHRRASRPTRAAACGSPLTTRSGTSTSTGQVQKFGIGKREALGVAVTPDGSAWFAFGTCQLAQVVPGGQPAYVAAPVPATSIATGPDGKLWLASPSRLDLGLRSPVRATTPRRRSR